MYFIINFLDKVLFSLFWIIGRTIMSLLFLVLVPVAFAAIAFDHLRERKA